MIHIDMLYDIWCIWNDVMIWYRWYETRRYDIRYIMIGHEMICYVMIRDIRYDDIRYDMMWYMICLAPTRMQTLRQKGHPSNNDELYSSLLWNLLLWVQGVAWLIRARKSSLRSARLLQCLRAQQLGNNKSFKPPCSTKGTITVRLAQCYSAN